MNPLDKITAAANRLMQKADSAGNARAAIELREIAASIRGGVASLRQLFEKHVQADNTRFNLIVGDEGQA